ncbi:MAG TPA: discoidin domain-containing protein, partial [Polyangiaceae bacterium]
GSTAGTSGTAGTGGSTAGTSAGGAGGTSGGDAGSNGTGGGNAGTGGSSAGASGAGGIAGTGGETGGTSGAAGTGGSAPITFSMAPISPVAIAPGSYTIARVNITNATEPVTITLDSPAVAGILPTPVTQTLDLVPGSTTVGSIALVGTDVSTGTGTFTVSASGTNVTPASVNFTLNFSTDLARNLTNPLAPFPLASASSSQAAQPPRFAFDNSASTFWVSSGSTAGQGPDPANPEWLAVDFGVPIAVGSVTMIPRGQRGPTAYTVEVSDDGASWTVVGTEATAADATITTTFTQVTTRYLRLYVTGSRDPGGPTCPAPCDPRNVQIIGMEVRP